MFYLEVAPCAWTIARRQHRLRKRVQSATYRLPKYPTTLTLMILTHAYSFSDRSSQVPRS